MVSNFKCNPVQILKHMNNDRAGTPGVIVQCRTLVKHGSAGLKEELMERNIEKYGRYSLNVVHYKTIQIREVTPIHIVPCTEP